MSYVTRLDTRGRLVIPSRFRDALNLEEGDEVMLSLNIDELAITVSPISDEYTQLVKLSVLFGDTPGTLAEVARYLGKNKIDLIKTESKTIQRGERARWTIIADLSRCKLKETKIKKDIKELGALSVGFEKIGVDEQ